MPVMDGLEMIEKLKKRIMTAQSSLQRLPGFQYRKRSNSVVTYLLKPFNNQDLVNKVEAWRNWKRSGKEAKSSASMKGICPY